MEGGVFLTRSIRVLVITDTHGSYKPVVHEGVELVLLLGDIEPWDVKKIEETYTVPIFGVLGNHNYERDYEESRVVNLHAKTALFGSVKFGGLQGCPTYKKLCFGQLTEVEAQKSLDALGQVDVILSHSNPAERFQFGNPTDGKRGFLSLLLYIHEKQPAYLFHGHLHENSETVTVNTTVFGVYTENVFDLVFE